MRHVSRRSLLAGASLISFMRLASAGINNPGSASSVSPFNGGRTQTNTSSVVDPGVYYFINWMKNGSSNNGADINYLSAPTDPTWPGVPILELDANGYPQTLVGGTGGYFTGFTIPKAATYSGTWVLKWDGTGTVTPANFSFTTTLSMSNRREFTNLDNTQPNWTSCFIFVQAFSNAPNHVTNLRMCRAADEAAMDAGAVFLPEHIALMKSAKPGAIRSLGWGGGFDGTNTALIGLWAQRKPVGYITYGAMVLNPNWCPPGGTGTAITTTNSGTDYTLAYSGFTLTDKVVVQFIFNADTTAQTTLLTKAWSTTNTVAVNINWTAHGLAVGNTVVMGQNSGGTIAPPGVNSAQIYFINNVIDANNFTVSATSGGSSVLATATSSGNMFISAVPRININSTGFVTMTDFQTPVPSNIGGINGVSPAKGLATIIYDQTTGWFHISRGGGGLIAGSPPERFIDYCAVIGANPWMTAPFMSQTTGGALGGCTDYMPSWVTYAKNTYPWMKPLIEPYNETWNGSLQGLGTFYASTLAYKLWPTQANAGGFPINEAYGKWVSDLGQAMSTIYGNDRTKYSMLCMSQGVVFNSVPGLNQLDSRLTSDWYVTVSGGQPAYKFCDRVGLACYYANPQADYATAEIPDAFNYYITNAGNPTAQAAIAETLAASANNGVNEFITLAYVKTLFTNAKAWGLGLNPGSTVPTATGGNTVKGICAYEGGWGPDVPIAANNWTTSVSTAAGSITNANPCVLTLNTNSTSSADGGVSGIVGNPGVVGQMINLQFVTGMTQINNSANAFGSTFTSSSASIAATNTLIVNQAVMFTTAPPAPFQIYVPYHVLSTGLSGTAYQLSATKGGSAIVAGANASNVFTQDGWFITAVGTSTITLDLDSTSFGTWTNAQTGQVTWTGGGAYSNALRVAAVTTNAMGTNNAQMYTDFFSQGGGGFTAEYPSNFLYFGVSGAWSVLQPTILNTTLTPQWNSIVAEN